MLQYTFIAAFIYMCGRH